MRDKSVLEYVWNRSRADVTPQAVTKFLSKLGVEVKKFQEVHKIIICLGMCVDAARKILCDKQQVQDVLTSYAKGGGVEAKAFHHFYQERWVANQDNPEATTFSLVGLELKEWRGTAADTKRR